MIGRMKVAVTGGTGFVGGHLVDALHRRGDTIACLVRAEGKSGDLAARGCRLVRGDLDDAESLESLVREAEVVYHVAGAVAAPSEAEYFRVNGEGAGRLARAAKAAGVGRVLLVSSLAVTGPSGRGRVPDESATPRPINPYGRSKQAGEEAVKAAGVPFTIVRPPAVYGPRDRQFLRLFRIVRRGLAPLPGDGHQELSLVHARDLAGAMVAAATTPATLGRTYHAAHSEVTTHRALVAGIARAMGRRVHVLPLPAPVLRGLLHVKAAAARLRGRRALLSPAKAAELLAAAWTCSSEALARDAGWSAGTGLEEGLAETAGWYKQAGWV
jgi:nucleoside-diphosphate-sugar epimerase